MDATLLAIATSAARVARVRERTVARKVSSLMTEVAGSSLLIRTRASITKVHRSSYTRSWSLNRVRANRYSGRASRSRGRSRSLMNSERYRRLLIITSSVLEFLKMRCEVEVLAVVRRVV